MKFNDIIAIIKNVITKNYFNFEGRANRAEFWWFVLFNFIVNLVLGLFGKAGTWLTGIWSLAILLPSLGVSVRRLHDINKSGWLLLLSLIPIIGQIILIIWWCKEGDKAENQYGPVPEDIKAE